MNVMNFDLKNAAVYQAVLWQKLPVFGYARNFSKIFFRLFLAFLALFAFFFLTSFLPDWLSAKFLGISVLSLVLFLFFWQAEIFFQVKLKNPGLSLRLSEALQSPDRYNLAEFLSMESAKAFSRAQSFCSGKKMEGADISALFYFLLEDNPGLYFIFSRLLLDVKEIKSRLKNYFDRFRRETAGVCDGEKDGFEKVLLDSFSIADKKGHDRVEIGDILTALARHEPVFRKMIIDFDIRKEDVENLCLWLESLEKKESYRKKFWEWGNLMRFGSLAKEWTSGFTITLDAFSFDVTESIKRKGLPEIIGHRQDIENIERVLSRQEVNNVLIIGEPHSGRRSVIYALAKRSITGESSDLINYKRIVFLDLASVIARSKNQKEVEKTLDAIFREAISAGNVILAIKDLHNYIGVTGLFKPGVIDIAGVLTPYLSMPSFQLMATSTYEGLHKNIEQNPSFLSLFSKVEVSQMSRDETLILLESLVLEIEEKYGRFFSYQSLRQFVNLTEKYFSASSIRESEYNLLDEIMVYVAKTGADIVRPEHVAKVISDKVSMPVGEIETKEKEVLLNLENLIHQRIINQEEAVKEVASALRRARAELTLRKGPMGSFLFLGPTGVGKTETCKALAEIYFGSESRMTRLDMSEFQNLSDIPRLLGSAGQEGLLTTPVRDNPFSLVLLDEFEKAHPNILNLFLQVLDEGSITDGMGRKVDFKNTIVIATSNAGYLVILEALKQATPWPEVKEQIFTYVFKNAIFRPELVNRFDAAVVFKPLSKENLLAISQLLLGKIKKNLAEKEIEFVITQDLKEKIADLAYDPTFGARNMQRVVQDKISNILARALLSNQLKRGDRVEVLPGKGEFTLKIDSIG